jgi:hypothetical protein
VAFHLRNRGDDNNHEYNDDHEHNDDDHSGGDDNHECNDDHEHNDDHSGGKLQSTIGSWVRFRFCVRKPGYH